MKDNTLTKTVDGIDYTPTTDDRAYKMELAATSVSDAERVTASVRAGIETANRAIKAIMSHMFDTVGVVLEDKSVEKFYIWDFFDDKNVALREIVSKRLLTLDNGDGKFIYLNIGGNAVSIQANRILGGTRQTDSLLRTPEFANIIGYNFNTLENAFKDLVADYRGVSAGDFAKCHISELSQNILPPFINSKLLGYVTKKMHRELASAKPDKLFSRCIKLALGWNGDDASRKEDNWKSMPKQTKIVFAQADLIGPDTHSYLNGRTPDKARWPWGKKSAKTDNRPYYRIDGRNVQIDEPQLDGAFMETYNAAMKLFVERAAATAPQITPAAGIQFTHANITIGDQPESQYQSSISVRGCFPCLEGENPRITLRFKSASRSRTGKFPYFADLTADKIAQKPTVTISVAPDVDPKDTVPEGNSLAKSRRKFFIAVPGTRERTEIKVSDPEKVPERAVAGIDVNSAVFWLYTSVPQSLVPDTVDFVAELDAWYKKYGKKIEGQLSGAGLVEREIRSVMEDLELNSLTAADPGHTAAVGLLLGARFGFVSRGGSFPGPDPLQGFLRFLMSEKNPDGTPKYVKGSRKDNIIRYTFLLRKHLRSLVANYERYFHATALWEETHDRIAEPFINTPDAAKLLEERAALAEKLSTTKDRLRAIAFLDTEYGKNSLRVIKMEDSLDFDGEPDLKGVPGAAKCIAAGWLDTLPLGERWPNCKFVHGKAVASVTLQLPPGQTAETISALVETNRRKNWMASLYEPVNLTVSPDGNMSAMAVASQECIERTVLARVMSEINRIMRIGTESGDMARMADKRGIAVATVRKEGTSTTCAATGLPRPKKVTNAMAEAAGVEGCRKNGWNYRCRRLFISFADSGSPVYGVKQNADQNAARVIGKRKIFKYLPK